MQITDKFYDCPTKALLDLLYGYLEALKKDKDLSPEEFFEKAIGPISERFLGVENRGSELAELYRLTLEQGGDVDGACEVQIVSVV